MNLLSLQPRSCMIGRQKACVTPSINPEKPVRPMATRLTVRAPSWSAPVPFALEQLRRFLFADHLAGIRGSLVGGRLDDLANGCPPCWTLLISYVDDLRTPVEGPRTDQRDQADDTTGAGSRDPPLLGERPRRA